jgi:hypothetical protein
MALDELFGTFVTGSAIFLSLFQAAKQPVNQPLLFRLHGSFLCHREYPIFSLDQNTAV